ncbi:uncharacterized protein TNCV_4855331 [Trichonephila clavipes]|nr:uncharacterized protein TNCV_4855331 [Trichonephila clavipes]
MGRPRCQNGRKPHNTKVLNAQPIGIRRKGRSNPKWIDGLEKDLLVFRTNNWRPLAGRRLAWKRLLEKSKAHLGCRATEEGRLNFTSNNGPIKYLSFSENPKIFATYALNQVHQEFAEHMSSGMDLPEKDMSTDLFLVLDSLTLERPSVSI